MKTINFPPRHFAARLASLNKVLAYTVSICNQAGLNNEEQMRVELVIEEIFTNTVCHGHGQDCDEPVWISAGNDNGNLCITYQDTAPAFNPLDRQADRVAPAIGGLGITLVERLAQPSYRYENGRNTLLLKFPPAVN